MKYLLPSLLLVLAGCGTVAPRPQPVVNTQQQWQQHQKQLQPLIHWQLSGRLAVQKAHEAWHMSLQWEQHRDNYTLNIIAPLGQGALRLQGNALEVVLTTDEGESLYSDDPDQLLFQHLGWRVPISALRYWVLGLPAPGTHDKTLDEQGRLAQLQQDGWTVDFLDYHTQPGVALPRKVFISNHQAKVKLIIADWQSLSVPATENGA